MGCNIWGHVSGKVTFDVADRCGTCPLSCYGDRAQPFTRGQCQLCSRHAKMPIDVGIREPSLGGTNPQSLVPVAPAKGQDPAILPPCHLGHRPPLRLARQYHRAVQQCPRLLGAWLDLWGHCGSTQPAPEKVRDRAQRMENVSPDQHRRLGIIQPPLPITPALGHPVISHIPELTETELALAASKALWQGIATHREPPPGRAGWCPPVHWWPYSCTPRRQPPPGPGSAGSAPRPGPACGHPPDTPGEPPSAAIPTLPPPRARQGWKRCIPAPARAQSKVPSHVPAAGNAPGATRCGGVARHPQGTPG